MTETAEYGPFFDGYVASTDRTLIGRQAFSEDSRDCAVDPITGAIINRQGSAVRFDAAGALAGLLEAKWSARVRQLLALESESFADGQPNIAGLWTNRTTNDGQLWWRSSNGGDTNQVIGKSYGATHRSTANLTPWHFLMVPLWSESTTSKWTRCKSAAQRRTLFAGSNKVLRVGAGLLAPNRKGTPLWWNGKFNDDAASGAELEYVRPLGPMPPIFPIRRASVPGASAGNWTGSDKAYWAYAFKYATGEVSAPYLCNAGDAITVDAGNPANKYPYVTLTIPPAPPDCVERLIFRTNKWDSTSATAVIEDPTALLLTGVLRNRFQTAYRDYGGDDGSLRERPDLIRFDLFMPPRAKNVFTCDGRVVFSDLAINTAVIELAPYAADAAMLDTYSYTDAGAYGSTWFYWRNDGNNLTLKHNLGPGFLAATTDLTIALAGLTLQNVVDTINAVAPNAGFWPWRAQLLPGVDGNALASELETTNGTDFFDDDARCNDGTSGNQRVICGQTLPGVLHMSATSTWATSGNDKRGLHFTMANPAATGTEADAPLAPNAWRGSFDCRRRLEGGMGRMVGGGSLLDGALVLATGGVAVLRNIRGGKSGVDSDYRLEKWKLGPGCISWDGYAEGDGWVAYISRKGIMVNDGKREICISRRVWNPKANAGAGRGPWAYEIGQCLKWVAADDDSAHMHLAVAHGRLYVFYRSSAAATYPDRYMYYDFTASQNEIGVDQMLRPDGQPFAWSAPCRVNGGSVGVVTRDDGDHVYTAPDDLGAGHVTGDGVVVELELTGQTDDDGATQTMTVYLQADRFDSGRNKKHVSKVDLEYYDAGGVLTVSAATDFDRTTTAALTAVDPVTDGTISDLARLRVAAAHRGPIELFELKFTALPADDRIEVRNAQVEFRRLRTLAPA